MIAKKGNDCLKSMIVQGHLGLTPQTAVLLGGFKV
ncbi:MAG: 3-methyl-2-oxobutanoate hydroxymethyltransferase [Thermovirga sp.]|nr:3-methyl-2-oxobutanoate hydroxymethyltransferase [Thermovirga sp.]